MVMNLKIARGSWWKSLLGLLFLAIWICGASFALADASQDNLKQITVHIDKALAAAKANDVATAKTEFEAFDSSWDNIEDTVRAKSKDFYVAIEEKINSVEDALSANPVVPKDLQTALENLSTVNLAFINGAATVPNTNATTTGASAPATAPGGATTTASGTASPTVGTLLALLSTARDQQSKGDWDGTAATIKNFQNTWLDVEGQVKTRSVDAYKDTENDMALAYTLAQQKSADLPGVLTRMSTRLEPFENTNTYGIFDATIILLREGLEALLVVVALLAFLKKSGNETKQSWVWSGSMVGLAASIGLGVAIQVLFSNAINSSNREMLEGTVGLVAAFMLIYVSYWMHNKASTVAWQKYIRSKSTSALAKGSLFGLATLSFLAIFREGAETVLFFLGMGSGISVGDLILGLALGAALLVILGVLLVVVGVRIPMGPFFRVASILVFYLCFKFVGTGVHALQVAGILPTSTATYLPENGFFGLFPTWETTFAQIALILLGAGLVLFNHFKTAKEDTRTSAKPAESGTASAATE